MKRIIAAALLFLASAVAANAQAVFLTTCGTIPAAQMTPVAGNPAPLFVDLTGKLCAGGGTVTASITTWANGTLGAMANYGTSPGAVLVPGVNAYVTGDATTIAQGATYSAQTFFPVMGLASTNAPTATTGDLWALSISPASGGVRIDLKDSAANTNPFLVTGAPSAAAASGVSFTPAAASQALAANQVIKGSAGNLFSFEVSADATLSAAAWWVMIYDATSAPGDGAVTPAKCFAYPANTTSASYAWPTPISFSTGIVIGVSTTGCFTQTASVHAFISGDAK